MERTSFAISLNVGSPAALREPRSGPVKRGPAAIDIQIVDTRLLRAVPAALALLLAAVPPLAASTILVVVTETREGGPMRPPFAAREGILAALFEDGQIAFELPFADEPPPAERLPALGLATGADVVASVVVHWSEERIAGGQSRVNCRGSLVLLDVPTGRRTEEVPIDLDNAGRERDVGRAGLGLEIGAALIAAWRASPFPP
jgi:hypothetical protein